MKLIFSNTFYLTLLSKNIILACDQYKITNEIIYIKKKIQHISILSSHISRTLVASSGQCRTRHFYGRERTSVQTGL